MLSSILWPDGVPGGRHVLSEDAVKDLKLDRLFDASALSVLRIPCSADEIGFRCELFDFADKIDFDGLLEVCVSWEDAHRRMCASRPGLERSAAFICESERYAAMMRYLSAIPAEGRAASRLREEAGKVVSSPEFPAMISEIKDCREKLSVIRGCSVGAPPGKWLMHRRKADGSDGTPSGQSDPDGIIRCVSGLTGVSLHMPAHIARPAPDGVMEGLMRLCPDEIKRLEDFAGKYAFICGVPGRLLQELRFVRDMRNFDSMLRSRGIETCRPAVSNKRMIRADEVYDAALTLKDAPIVPNDALFDESEHMFFLTGANGGGKTTYLRAVGIMTVLFLAGCRTPCRSAEIYPFTAVYTHFPFDERFAAEGRLADETKRIDGILASADENSVVLLNETFSGTDEQKSERMVSETAKELNSRGCFGVWVTHIHAFGDSILPALSVEVDKSDSNRRTYKVVRKTAIGGSYARDILYKYGLTGEQLEKQSESPASQP